ncbi:MAG TPA: DUF3180 domain-containing protein [Mycobacteriales bacterium]|nr:DUF3180 domain-containing protein [Mycobacteriales bacterium]
MTPTRPGLLVLVAVVTGALAYVVADTAYGSVPDLPAGAPVSLLLVAVVELVLARVVRDRVMHRPGRDGRPPRRALHPLQVARAAVLAKASSMTGALLLGAYAGLFAWTAPRTDVLSAARGDVVVSGLSALAAAGLVVAALLLERACRVPTPPEDSSGVGPD